MKAIKALLRKRKTDGSYKGGRKSIDSKLIEKIFEEIALREIKNICSVDLGEISFKDRVLYIRAAHPAIASEICKKREKIKVEINKELEQKVLDAIKAK